MEANEIINHSALGRFYGVQANAITKNNIPTKYKYSYRLLLLLIEMWMNLTKEDDYTHKFKKS